MDIAQSRRKIDELDRRILELFIERLQTVEDIADYKQQRGLDVFDPVREAERLRSASATGGERYSDCTRKLMSEMMTICRDYQSLLMAKNLKG